MAPRRIAVIDIGKTNAKLALVDLETKREIALRRMPNVPAADGPYPHHDVDGLWDFILSGLADLNREAGIDAIAVTTHGATAALLDANGKLALPVLDYEHNRPDKLRSEYERVRAPFAETGSPALPAGLNLGAQIFWQAREFPEAFSAVRTILTYPQYWTFRLSGVAANETTSLGCHTDLWNPRAGDFSTLVDGQNWRRLMAPVRGAAERLANLLPHLAERTGIAAGIPVLCGIHDSNASLLPHILGRRPPFSVVSTGTWVVAMSVGGRAVPLDPSRDTLVNVSALGTPVPSARFMGGREWSELTAGLPEIWTEGDVETVLHGFVMLLPAMENGSGPFQGRKARWLNGNEPAGAARLAAVSFYAALMTATCLDLIGAEGPIVVEGSFSGNALFLRMLAAAFGRPVLSSDGATGTSVGAAMLAAPLAAGHHAGGDPIIMPGPLWSDYARRWIAEAEAR